MGLTRTRFIQADTAKAKIEDPITVLNSNSTAANVDVGFLINRNLGVTSNVALFWDESGSEFATAFTSNTGTTDSNILISSYAGIRAGQFKGNIGPASDIANVYITGSLIPSANISYDLGSNTNRFATLWLSGNTIVLGAESVSVTNSNWTFTTSGNNIVLGSESTFDKVIAGNITVTNNLTVLGTTISAASNNVTYQDSIIELHTQANLAPLTSDDGRDIGLKFHYYKTQDEHALLGWINSTGYLEWYDSGREGVGNVFTGNTYGTIKSGGLILANNTPSTSTSTGALRVTGGVGIVGNVYAGNVYATTGSFDFVVGTITSSSQPNITDLGTLVNLDVAGSSSLSGFTTFQGSGAAEYTVKFVGPDKDKLAISTGEATSIGIGLYSLTNDESNYSNLRLQARSIDFRTGSAALNQNSKVRIDEIGNLLINTATTSTSTTTGALVVNGGAGIAGNIHANAIYTTTGLFWSGNSQAFQSYGNVDLASYLLTNTGNISSNFFLGGNVVAGNVQVSGNIYGGIVPTAIYKDVFIGTTAVSLARGSQSLTVDNFNTTGYALQANLAALATNATKTTVTSNVSSGTAYITFVSSATGNVDQNINTALTYDPNSGNLRSYASFVDTDLSVGNVLYVASGIRWSGNGNVFASGGGGGGTFTASATAPVVANDGDFWYNTTSDILLQYLDDGTNTYWVDVQSPTLFANTATTTVLGETTITGNLVPSANITYSLGTTTQRFKDLFLSGTTIDLGGATIKTDADSGAIALIPLPTVENPNPTGIVVSPAGTISTVETSGGTVSGNAISSSANNAVTTGTTTFGNVVVNDNLTAANLTANSNVTATKITTTDGVFWSNGVAFSSGLSSAQVNARVWAQKIFWG